MRMLILMVGISTLLTACDSSQCGNTKLVNKAGLDPAFLKHVCKQTHRANQYLGIKKAYTITLVRNDDTLLNTGRKRLAWATPDAIRIGVYPTFKDKTLFHEIRHIWQYENGMKPREEYASYSAWSNSSEEKDANRFGRKAVVMWGAW